MMFLWLNFAGKETNQLAAIEASQVLRVSTLNSADTYFFDKATPSGFEFDLINAFADHLGVKLTLSIRDNLSELNTDLANRDSHISIAGRTTLAPISNLHQTSVSYIKNQSVVVYRETRGKPYPRAIENLADRKLILAADSVQELQMQKLKNEYSKLDWVSLSHWTTYEILEQILAKKSDIAIISFHDFQSIGPFFPGLKIAFELADPADIHWLTANKEDHSLKSAIDKFLLLPETKELIAQLAIKYYNNSNPLNFYDTVTFKKDFNSRLPKLEPLFKKAAKKSGIDWLLLASIAYQESHWNPKAVSSTGVKGIMMLTKAAAKEVNVTNRIDPKQSIFGGTQYLLNVIAKIPDRVKEPDRTYLALAGYNTGFGHLEDARILTSRAGLNPDSWDDVKKHLPLLTKPKYHKTVKHGYARGYEPVNYVKGIRQYLKVLTWEKEQQKLKDSINQALGLSEDIGMTDKPSETEPLKSIPPLPAPSTL